MDKIKEIEDNLKNITNAHETFLNELVSGHYLSRSYFLKEETQFIVARKWNSWYPSFFKIEGGCYVIVPNTDENSKIVVVDPGFKFLEILRLHHNIEPSNIGSLVISHLHPDHTAGLIEFCTLMNSIKKHCKIYLNKSTYDAYTFLSSSYIEMVKLKEEYVLEIESYKCRGGGSEKIFLHLYPSYHREMGNKHNSLSLIVQIKYFDNEGNINSNTSIAIVGDTDGNDKYLDYYVDRFSDSDIIVLHLGSYFHEEDSLCGYKHLYFSGTKNLLKKIRAHLVSKGNNFEKSKKIVVLSEFGLELGTSDEIIKQLKPFIMSYIWRVPLIYYQKKRDVDKGVSSKYLLNLYTKLVSSLVDIADRIVINNKTLLLEILAAESIRNLVYINPNPDEDKEMGDLLDLILNERDSYYKQYHTYPKDPNKIIKLLEAKETETESHIAKSILKIKDLQSILISSLVESGGREYTSINIDNMKIILNIIDELLKSMLNIIYDPFQFTFFSNTWKYVFQFCESVGIISKDEIKYVKEVPHRHQILYALIGIYAFSSVFKKIDLKQFVTEDKESSNNLLLIGELLQKENDDWCKIIIGDVDTCFSLTKPIKLRDGNLEWKDPASLKAHFNDSESKIFYK